MMDCDIGGEHICKNCGENIECELEECSRYKMILCFDCWAGGIGDY